MNTPYQRITVPTSEKWNSAGQNGTTAAPSSVHHASLSNSSAELVKQPPRQLIINAPQPPTLNNKHLVSTKKTGKLQQVIWAWLLVGLLIATTSAFAAQEQVKQRDPETQAPSTDMKTARSTSIPLEKSDMSQPTNTQSISKHTRIVARTKNTAASVNQKLPVELMDATQPQSRPSLQDKDENNKASHVENMPVSLQTAPLTQHQQGEEGNVAPDIAQTTIVLDATIANKELKKPIVLNEMPNNLDTRKLALLALGIAGVGTIACAGLTISTRRSFAKVEKFKFNDLGSELVPTPSEKNTQNKLAPKTSALRGASDLAYIDQKDWAAALERTYGVNVGQGPYNALVSLVGARNANEDFGCSYEINDVKTGKSLHCVFVADGCGGHNGGRDASCLAVRAASEAVLQSIKLSPTERVKAAFQAASAALIRAGRLWDADSLRTTLIIVLADESNYYCGWIGDGGIDLHRSNGHWESLLKPHKCGAQNLLAASLGPDQVGEPSFVSHARQPGDRIYIGSDGVFDVYSDPKAFWGSWFEGATTTKSPQTCLTELLAKCAEHEAFDDNMTVAYLHTPTLHATVTAVKSTEPQQRLIFGVNSVGHQTA